MYEIIDKKELTPGIHLLEINAPMIAKNAKAGQFVMLMIDDVGERIPLTMADWNAEKGTITIIALEVGKTTMNLGKMKKGDKLRSVVGPLGLETEGRKYGTVVSIGGGIGIALMYPVVRALKQAGNKVISIMGAKTAETLILEDEIAAHSDELFICTDDGTKGHHGFVSDILKQQLDESKQVDMVYAVGPIIMMKVITDITRPYEIETIVSLNPIMVDGTGMCGSCRVSVDGKMKFACVDGPEFDGHKVDFQLLIERNKRYLEEEKLAIERYAKEVKGGG